jgi:hypothetical protein
MTGICSPRVRQIVMLRVRVARLRAQYEGGRMRLEPVRSRAERLAQEARALKGRLTACELAELRRRWSGV